MCEPNVLRVRFVLVLQDPPTPNLYSPHSWLGLTALLLGLTQVGGVARRHGQDIRATRAQFNQCTLLALLCSA